MSHSPLHSAVPVMPPSIGSAARVESQHHGVSPSLNASPRSPVSRQHPAALSVAAGQKDRGALAHGGVTEPSRSPSVMPAAVPSSTPSPKSRKRSSIGISTPAVNNPLNAFWKRPKSRHDTGDEDDADACSAEGDGWSWHRGLRPASPTADPSWSPSHVGGSDDEADLDLAARRHCKKKRTLSSPDPRRDEVLRSETRVAGLVPSPTPKQAIPHATSPASSPRPPGGRNGPAKTTPVRYSDVPVSRVGSRSTSLSISSRPAVLSDSATPAVLSVSATSSYPAEKLVIDPNLWERRFPTVDGPPASASDVVELDFGSTDDEGAGEREEEASAIAELRPIECPTSRDATIRTDSDDEALKLVWAVTFRESSLVTRRESAEPSFRPPSSVPLALHPSRHSPGPDTTSPSGCFSPLEDSASPSSAGHAGYQPVILSPASIRMERPRANVPSAGSQTMDVPPLAISSTERLRVSLSSAATLPIHPRIATLAWPAQSQEPVEPVDQPSVLWPMAPAMTPSIYAAHPPYEFGQTSTRTRVAIASLPDLLAVETTSSHPRADAPVGDDPFLSDRMPVLRATSSPQRHTLTISSPDAHNLDGLDGPPEPMFTPLSAQRQTYDTLEARLLMEDLTECPPPEPQPPPPLNASLCEVIGSRPLRPVAGFGGVRRAIPLGCAVRRNHDVDVPMPPLPSDPDTDEDNDDG